MGTLTVVAQVGNRAGSVDLSLSLGLQPGPNSQLRVNAVEIQPDGKVIIGGRFSSQGAVTRYHLIRFNLDNTIDTTFNVTISSQYTASVDHIALQSDGKIVIAGIFDVVNGVEKIRIARLNPDGSVDGSFSPSLGSHFINFIKVQPDNRVIISSVPTAGEGNAWRVARFNADGSLDSSFGFAGANAANAGALDGGGKLTLCRSYFIGPTIFRANPDGTIDSGFNVSLTNGSELGTCNGLRELSDGRTIVWGGFDAVNGIPRRGLAILNSDGTLAQSFVPGIEAGCATGYDGRFDAQLDGKIIFAASGCGGKIGRLSADGSLDRTFRIGRTSLRYFGNPSDPLISTIRTRGARRLLVGGQSFRFDGVPRNGLIQIKL